MTFVSVDKSDELLNISLVFKGHGAIVKKGINAVTFPLLRVFNKHTQKSIHLQKFFELCTCTILSLFLESLKVVGRTIFIISRFKIALCNDDLQNRDMTFTHIGFRFQFGQPQLDLMNFISDILANNTVVFDIQTSIL